MVSVSFDIEPDEAGTFVYQLRVAAPPDDANPRDNQREAEVDVVDRKTRVLLFASGPMRDYQYLRNQLYRDRTMTVDVFCKPPSPASRRMPTKFWTSSPARPRSCTNTIASSRSTRIGPSSTVRRSSCWKSGLPRRRAA